MPHLNHDDVEPIDASLRGSSLFCGSRKSGMSRNIRNVERVLEDIGQSPRQMDEAPRDGRKILGKSAKGLVVCYWDAQPSKMAGPLWVEAPDAERGYLDRYFIGWLDPATLKLFDYAILAELLVAYIDDASAAGNSEALDLLYRRAKPDQIPPSKAT